GEATGCQIQALVPISGRPMISYVLDALRAAKTVSQIFTVGAEPLRQEVLTSLIERQNFLSAVGGAVSADKQVVFVPEVGEMLSNIRAGLAAVKTSLPVETGPTSGFVLLSTADIPLLTPEAVDDFVCRAAVLNADFCYPIVTKEAVQAKYPSMGRTFVGTKDGVFTGGNLFLLKAEFFDRLAPVVEKVRAARKNPIKLAALLGPATLFLFAIKRISIEQVEKRAARLFGGKLRAVVSPYPEIAADVDKPEDLRAAEAMLEFR
ncbi:MAG: NTP transferase domain-containing protein, partial [Anaerolineae bacterium]